MLSLLFVVFLVAAVNAGSSPVYAKSDSTAQAKSTDYYAQQYSSYQDHDQQGNNIYPYYDEYGDDRLGFDVGSALATVASGALGLAAPILFLGAIGFLASLFLPLMGITIDVGTVSARSSRKYHHKPAKLGDYHFIKLLKQLDPIDLAFNIADVKSKDCRKKAVCELEQKLAKTPLLTMVLKYISQYVPGLTKYDDAVNYGLNKEDCAVIYNKCELSLIDMVMA